MKASLVWVSLEGIYCEILFVDVIIAFQEQVDVITKTLSSK